MRLDKFVWGFLLLAFLGYIGSIALGNALAYFLFFILLVGTLLLKLAGVAVNLVWKLLPEDYKKGHAEKRTYFNMVIFFSFILFYFLLGIVEDICLPSASGFISLLGKTIALVFVVLLGWHLIRRGKVKTMVTSGVLFVLLVPVLLLLLSSQNYSGSKSEQTIKDNPIQKLGSLGYVTWVRVEKGGDIEKKGVMYHNQLLAFDGINLYNSDTSPEAYLIDMGGNIVHKWTKNVNGCNSWAGHVELCENGDLLVAATDQMVIQLDWDSTVKWTKRLGVHHDFDVDRNGKIHALTRKRRVIFWQGIPVPIVDDYITVLSPKGEIEREISIYELVKNKVERHRIAQIYEGMLKAFEPKNVVRILMLRISKFKEDVLVWSDLDILHTNAIEIMDRDIEGFCKKDDWLISIRDLDLVGIVDSESEQLVWHWGPGEISRQHQPTLVKNGNILIFDNGVEKGYSRVVELEPDTKKIAWEYKSEASEKFFSEIMGGNQRLPNGNTLITESAKGHVFEITKDGTVVWDFYNPRVNVEGEKREIIYRMTRITDAEIYERLNAPRYSVIEPPVEKALVFVH